VVHKVLARTSKGRVQKILEVLIDLSVDFEFSKGAFIWGRKTKKEGEMTIQT